MGCNKRQAINTYQVLEFIGSLECLKVYIEKPSKKERQKIRKSISTLLGITQDSIDQVLNGEYLDMLIESQEKIKIQLTTQKEEKNNFSTDKDNPIKLEKLLSQFPKNIKKTMVNGLIDGIPSIIIAIYDKGLNSDIETLIDHGVDVNITDTRGRTPLIHAVMQNNIEIVEKLLHRDANIHQRDIRGKTAMFYAIICKNTQIFEALIKKGANTDIYGLNESDHDFLETMLPEKEDEQKLDQETNDIKLMLM